MEEVKCDVCKHPFKLEDEPSMIGVSFDIGSEHTKTKGHSEAKRVFETFGKGMFNICYCCWIKSFGVKPKKKIKSSL